MPSAPTTRLLGALKGVKQMGPGWIASCPVTAAHSHGDRNPSLKIDEASDGRVLVRCHAGCAVEDVCDAVGIELADLFLGNPSEKGVLLEVYDYTAEDGSLVFQVLRYWPKTFSQRRPDGKGGWTHDVRGLKSRPLFRLPRVVEAVRLGTPVVVVEGERDVLALEALGKVATTNAGGAGKWRTEHTEALRGAKVRIVCDTDPAGRKHAEQVAAALRGIATEVTCWEPTKGKDVRSHLQAGGEVTDFAVMGTTPALRIVEGSAAEEPGPEALVSMVRDGDSVIGESPLPGTRRLDFEATNVRNERTGLHGKVRLLADGVELAYSVLNVDRDEDRTRLANSAAKRMGGDRALGEAIKLRLDRFASGLWEAWTEGDAPTIVRGRDLPAAEYLLEPYLTKSKTILFAPGGSAKSWLALVWALTLHHGLSSSWVAREQTGVLYLDFEDERQAMESRLFQLAGLLDCPAEIPAYFAEGKGLKETWDGIRRYVDQAQPALLIVDSISRLGLGKLVEDDAANRAIDMLNRLGLPWLALAHTPKANGEHVFGSAMYEYGARVVIKGEASQNPDDAGLIGLRLTITKANHLRLGQTQTWAFRFAEDRLIEHRLAKSSDFPDLGPQDQSITAQVSHFLLETGSAGASEIAEELGLDRSRVAHVLNEGHRFGRVGKDGRRVLWAVVSDVAG